jgi:hypothetical protein
MVITSTWKYSIAAIIGLSVTACATHSRRPAEGDAAALSTFHSRVEAYDHLRQDAERTVGALHTADRAAEVTAQEHQLAAEIRRVRANAHRGDIFSADVEAFFRSALTQVTTGDDGARNVDAIRDEWPAAIALQVNGEYPDTKPLSRVPAAVLAALPKLPRGIEYRFVPKYLLLYDARADLMIDYMPISLRAGAP